MAEIEFPYTIADESKAQNTISPGPIRNQETLMRVLHHPEHFDENEQLRSNAIPLNHLKVSGLSMDREDGVNHEAIQKRIKQQQERDSSKRKNAMQAQALCSSIRGIQDERETRAFVVIDQAEEDNKAHSCVYSLPRGDAQVRGVRDKLLDLFQSNVSEYHPPAADTLPTSKKSDRGLLRLLRSIWSRVVAYTKK